MPNSGLGEVGHNPVFREHSNVTETLAFPDSKIFPSGLPGSRVFVTDGNKWEYSSNMSVRINRLCIAILLAGSLSVAVAEERFSAQQASSVKPTQARPLEPMADSNPSFEVATIKPTDPAHPGRYFRVAGLVYYAHDVSLADLIDLSYGVHPSQVIDAPDWVRTEKFDLAGTHPGEADPGAAQWLAMIRDLLTDRFALKLRREQRELASYVLTVDKSGPKNLTPSTSTNPYPSLEFNRAPNGVVLPARNAALSQFCQMMQQVVLDRPVVDRTGLNGKFDFLLTFLPNESQFDGHPPITAQQVTGEPAPDLFEAMRTQLGLKLQPAKVPTSVLILEHAERPTAN